jgi:hypothetical protein
LIQHLCSALLVLYCVNLEIAPILKPTNRWTRHVMVSHLSFLSRIPGSSRTFARAHSIFSNPEVTDSDDLLLQTLEFLQWTLSPFLIPNIF